MNTPAKAPMTVIRSDPPPDVPYSIEAEEALLGSILLDPGAVSRVKGIVNPADFYRDKSRWIYTAALDVHRAGRPVDYITVCDQLRTDERLDDVGGAHYLTGLLTETISSSHAEHYARIVARDATRRRMIDLGGTVSKNAHELEDIRALFADAQRRLDALRDAASPQADPWEPLDLEQVLAPATYAVAGLVTHGDLIMVYGPPGSKKSLLVADMVVCVACGRAWLPSWDMQHPGRQTTAAPVVWVDFDNGRRRTTDRFQALKRAYGLDGDLPLQAFSMPSPWLDPTNATSVDALIERVQRHRAAVVVIDALSNVKGDADENTGEMALVMAGYRRLAETTGAAVILIHHRNKGTGSTRAGDALRGHSSIEASLDLALMVECEDGSATGTVKATKVRGAPVAPFGFYFTYEGKLDSDELHKARMFGVPMANEEGDESIDDAIVEAVSAAHLEGKPLNQSRLVKVVQEAVSNVGRNRIRARAELLVSKRRIVALGGQVGKARTYGPA